MRFIQIVYRNYIRFILIDCYPLRQVKVSGEGPVFSFLVVHFQI